MTHVLRLARFVAPYRARIAVALAALVIAAGCVLAAAIRSSLTARS